jgi:general secretion pathway protein M
MSAVLKDRWSGLAAREKRLVKIAATIVALAVLIGVLIDPALRNVAQIEKSLPAARQDLATVRAYAEEARRLNAASTGSNRAAVANLKEEMEKSADRAGLNPGVKVTVSAGQASLTITKVNFSVLNDWLNSVPRELGVQVIRAKIERAGGVGLVSGELVFDGLGPKP